MYFVFFHALSHESYVMVASPGRFLSRIQFEDACRHFSTTNLKLYKLKTMFRKLVLLVANFVRLFFLSVEYFKFSKK